MGSGKTDIFISQITNPKTLTRYQLFVNPITFFNLSQTLIFILGCIILYSLSNKGIPMKNLFFALLLGLSVSVSSANGLREDFQSRVSSMDAEFVLYETKTGSVYDKNKAYIGHGKVQYQNKGFIAHYDKWMDEPADRALFGTKGEVWVWENDTKEGALLADAQTPFVHPMMPFADHAVLTHTFDFSYGQNTVILSPKDPDSETARIVFNFKRESRDCGQGKPDCLHLLSVYTIDKYKNTSLYVFKEPKYNQVHKGFAKQLEKLAALSR